MPANVKHMKFSESVYADLEILLKVMKLMNIHEIINVKKVCGNVNEMFRNLLGRTHVILRFLKK